MPDTQPISLNQLPAEVQDTLKLVDQGGPFPYRKDGTFFKNLEGHLPTQPPGYYREYTVVTPEATDRGSRRLIIGQGGEKYYTSDHYNNFQKII